MIEVVFTDADRERIGVEGQVFVDLAKLTIDDLIELDEQAGLTLGELGRALELGKVKGRSTYLKSVKALAWLALRTAGHPAGVSYTDLRLSISTDLDAPADQDDGEADGEGKAEDSAPTSKSSPPS